jgi:hypothetical protein
VLAAAICQPSGQAWRKLILTALAILIQVWATSMQQLI